MAKQDVKLTDYGNYYDFSLTDEGDIETEDSFEASIIVSLLVDKRANANEVPIPSDRRGWIGSIGESHIIGSKLWLYSQSRAIDSSLLSIRNEVMDACKHFVEDSLVKNITADAEFLDGRLLVTLSILRFTSKVDYRHYELWDNTGE